MSSGACDPAPYWGRQRISRSLPFCLRAYAAYAAYTKNGMPMRLGRKSKIESYRVLSSMAHSRPPIAGAPPLDRKRLVVVLPRDRLTGLGANQAHRG